MALIQGVFRTIALLTRILGSRRWSRAINTIQNRWSRRRERGDRRQWTTEIDCQLPDTRKDVAVASRFPRSNTISALGEAPAHRFTSEAPSASTPLLPELTGVPMMAIFIGRPNQRCVACEADSGIGGRAGR